MTNRSPDPGPAGRAGVSRWVKAALIVAAVVVLLVVAMMVVGGGSGHVRPNHGGRGGQTTPGLATTGMPSGHTPPPGAHR